MYLSVFQKIQIKANPNEANNIVQIRRNDQEIKQYENGREKSFVTTDEHL
jgi:hypothetical protein